MPPSRPPPGPISTCFCSLPWGVSVPPLQVPSLEEAPTKLLDNHGSAPGWRRRPGRAQQRHGNRRTQAPESKNPPAQPSLQVPSVKVSSGPSTLERAPDTLSSSCTEAFSSEIITSDNIPAAAANRAPLLRDPSNRTRHATRRRSAEDAGSPLQTPCLALPCLALPCLALPCLAPATTPANCLSFFETVAGGVYGFATVFVGHAKT